MSDQTLRRYLAEASLSRPIHWYEDQAQAVVAWGLPKWVDKPTWPGDPDDPAYVVLRRQKLTREVCPKGRGKGDRHAFCETHHTLAEFYGLVPQAAFARQQDAVEWALTDLLPEEA